MNSPFTIALANHLWQSTLFAVAAGLFTLFLRKNGAGIRYWVWFAASVKFLVPFSLLAALGAQMPWSVGPVQGSAMPTSFMAVVGQIAAPVPSYDGESAVAGARVTEAIDSGSVILIALGMLWALGTLAVASRWFGRWMQIRRALRDSMETRVEFVVPVRSSSSQMEPGVVGILRPVLLVPEGLDERLTPEQMRAVLAHERCHVTRRDNLTAAFHMLVEGIFWFHPLIWWLGARLVEERERACDEQVLRDGHAPESYAEGILNVCQHYVESRLPCVAGVSGSNLRQRIEGIMRNTSIEKLSGMRKAALAIAACAAVGAPVAVGILTSPQAVAQSGPGEWVHRNVSIQLTPEDGKSEMWWLFDAPTGLMRIRNYTLSTLIASAYAVTEPEVVGPDSIRQIRYDITAEGPPLSVVGLLSEERRAMGRDLLEKHFGLVAKRERKEMDGYVLAVGATGPTLESSTAGASFSPCANGITVQGLPPAALVSCLSNSLGAPVVDETGLQDRYDYAISWGPPDAPADPAAVAKALQEQLGLRLEARPVTVDVIHIVGLKAPQDVVTKQVSASGNAGLPRLALDAETFAVLEGRWTGRQGAYRVTLRFEAVAEGRYRAFYANEDLKIVVPVSEASVNGTRLNAKVDMVGGELDVDRSGNTLTGTWFGFGMSAPDAVTLVRN